MSNQAEVIATTGRLLTRMNQQQLERVQRAAADRGWYVTEYLRRRIVPHILARRGGAS